nr:PREDICTED: RNA-binding protein 34 [Musa acuminata subsp. malaccensis]
MPSENPRLLSSPLQKSNPAMGRKSKDSDQESSAVVKSLFSDDNPFRRKPQPESPLPTPELGLGLAGKPSNLVGGGVDDAQEARKRKRSKGSGIPNPSLTPASIPNKRNKYENGEDSGSPKENRKKRKRREIEEEYEKRIYDAAENVLEGDGVEGRIVAVGEKRKAADVVSSDMEVSKEAFDDESKLMRTVFVGNLPLKTKRKSLQKEFLKFGEVESVRIRSVPIVYSKTPRAIVQGKINDAVDSVHAYIVFKDEQSAKAALSHNMAQFGGNHIRVDMACPPRKKLRGDGPLYDKKRTVFVGNLPFDVKDEELYQLFCGVSEIESNVEAIRVVRDPQTSLGKGIAYVLFKTRDAATSVAKRRDLKVRDRMLRVCHAKSADATPSKSSSVGPKRQFPGKTHGVANGGTSSAGENDKSKVKAASLSYQGVRSSKSGVMKKSNLRPQVSNQGNNKRGGGSDQMAPKAKRPAVAARKAKQLLKKRKLEAGTPLNTHVNKKARKD